MAPNLSICKNTPIYFSNTYSLILIGRHGGKRCLREYKRPIMTRMFTFVHGCVFRRQIDDMETWLITMHRI